MYRYYQSWVSHVGNIRKDYATETEIVVLLLVWYFLGPNLLDEEAAVKSASMSSLTSGFPIGVGWRRLGFRKYISPILLLP